MKRLDKEAGKIVTELNISNLVQCLEAEVTYHTCWDYNGKKTKKIVFEYTDE
jgi:hypothetical protein|tara:strand:+ start:1529 stop:1684 length:156 start_codon:yes stop_codon:yes gene_type:complete